MDKNHSEKAAPKTEASLTARIYLGVVALLIAAIAAVSLTGAAEALRDHTDMPDARVASAVPPALWDSVFGGPFAALMPAPITHEAPPSAGDSPVAEVPAGTEATAPAGTPNEADAPTDE